MRNRGEFFDVVRDHDARDTERLVEFANQTDDHTHGDRIEPDERFVVERFGVQTVELDEATFLAEPSESNRIWIDGKPLEGWLRAQAGSSRCCDECGDNHCRTVEVGGRTYEVIPEELLVRAGMIAGKRMLDPTQET